jgi:hypothetical protein
VSALLNLIGGHSVLISLSAVVYAYFESNQIPRRFSDDKNGWNELGEKFGEEERVACEPLKPRQLVV